MKRPHRSIITVLLILLSFSVSGQELALPELKGFKKLSSYPVFTAVNLWDFINGAAEKYIDYGFTDLQVAEYKKGRDIIKLEVYRHKDNILAFGIYTSERSPSGRFLELGAQGYNIDGSINFYKGVYYVKIRTLSEKEKTIQSAYALANRVAEMLPGETSMPAILSQFPSEGRKQNEDAYINENILGHNFLDKAFRANYESGPDNFSIYIFDRPAQKDLSEMVNAYLKELGMDQESGEEGRIVLDDGYNDTVFLSWKGGRMVLITGLAKDQSDIADRYTSEILK